MSYRVWSECDLPRPCDSQAEERMLDVRLHTLSLYCTLDQEMIRVYGTEEQTSNFRSTRILPLSTS
jgi:hypothetical protein